jgi:hypothetical protein
MKASCYRAFLAVGFCACALGSQVQAQTVYPRASSDEHSPQEAYDSGFSLDGVAEHEKPTADKYYRLLLRAREASANDQLELSAELYKQLTDDNSYDPSLWTALGDVLYRSKQCEPAAQVYQKGLPGGFDTFANGAYQIARAYACAGNSDNAFKWLNSALAHAYEDRPEIAKDPAFEALRGDQRFSEVIGALPDRSFSRDDGWRYDLAYLVAEIKRLHFYYRREPLPPSFDDQVQALKENIPKLSDQAILVEFQSLQVQAGGAHTILSPIDAKRGASRQLPVHFYLFSDGLYIINAPDEQKQWIGARVLKFGDTSTDVAIHKVEALIPRDNPMTLLYRAPMYLTFSDMLKVLGIIPDGAEVPLTVEDRMGHQQQIVVKSRPGERDQPKKLIPSRLPQSPPAPLYLKNVRDLYWFEHLADQDVVYFQFNQVHDKGDESIKQFALRLQTFLDEHMIHDLIVDLRHNSGGDGGLLVPLLRTLIHFDTTRRNPKLFVITGRNTFSAAQNFIGQIERNTNAVFAGEPSSSRPNVIGEVAAIQLPFSGARGSVSSRYFETYDYDDARMWIAPTIPETLSSQAYFSNEDPVLDAILEIIRSDDAKN